MSEMGGGSAFDDEPQGETFPCPNCGHQLPVGTPICGNCGTVLQGSSSVPTPLAAAGIKPGTVIRVLFVVAVVVAGFLGQDRIADFFDSVGDSVEDAVEDAAGGSGGGGGAGEDGTDRGGGGGGAKPREQSGYRTIGALVRDLRAGGVPCTDVRVDAHDSFLSSGSCQSNGMHVQITMYYEERGIEFAEDFYAKFAFASVHADNWWVSGDTALMRRIKAALGGRLHVPT